MADDQTLDPVLLRSFLAVAETLHFTAAARRRGVSQSTISQHVGRLEQSVGRTLLLRSTKAVELTVDGTAMVDLAQDILAAQDRALGYFDRTTLRGRLRFGVSEDLAMSRLPDILRRFRRAHPLVDLELEVGLSSQLAEKLDGGRLDLMFAKRLSGDPRGLTVWREPLLWLGGPEWRDEPDRPVPLVLFPGVSITRKAAIDTLNRHRRRWHVAFSSPSLSALSAAVRAGFGITAQSSLLGGSDLMVLSGSAGLPPLPEVEFIVRARHQQPTGPAAALLEAIRLDTDLLRSRPVSHPLPAGADAAAAG